MENEEELQDIEKYDISDVNFEDENFVADFKFEDTSPLSVNDFLWAGIIMLIPIVNIIALIVWATNPVGNVNKKNMARAGIIIFAGLLCFNMMIIFNFAVMFMDIYNEVTTYYEYDFYDNYYDDGYDGYNDFYDDFFFNEEFFYAPEVPNIKDDFFDVSPPEVIKVLPDDAFEI